MDLEKALKHTVDDNTPEETKQEPLIDLTNKEEFTLTLDKAFIEKHDLTAWFANYKKEAMASTGGIRGPQNILYPWDTRFPINMVGVALATLGKALVAKDKKDVVEKLACCEVRYNSRLYVELIARVQAAQGITTHLTKDMFPIPIWLISFLVFKLDMYGGEYVTSSHAVSTKIATKDLNEEGGQYVPEESMQFIEKVEQVLQQAMEDKYEITFSPRDDEHIDESLLQEIRNGADLYAEYLRSGVATKNNITLIKNLKQPLYIECVGGSIYPVQKTILETFGVADKFAFLNTPNDPFFHGVGKTDENPVTGKHEYYDYSCDATLREVQKTLGYEHKMADKPIGTIIEITDPDADRLTVAQVEPANRKSTLHELGIHYMELTDEKVLTFYTPNQFYLMVMDYHLQNLRNEGLLDKHPRFLLSTTASSLAWLEWAKQKNIPVVLTPVGFKEFADLMRKIESQLQEHPDKEVVIKDIFGEEITLGVQPRILFAGEESGGMITGPEEPIMSNKGRSALAMREKSAGEAMVITSALAGYLEQEGMLVSEYLAKIFEENKITMRRSILYNNVLYDENNPDPEAMKKEKAAGESFRDANDRFFKSLCFAFQDNLITTDDLHAILKEALPNLDIPPVTGAKFCGDGSIFTFEGLYIEVRKSGTDAKIKCYGMGPDEEQCQQFAQAFASYAGEKTPCFTKIPEELYDTAIERGQEYYLKFLEGTH